MKASEFVKEEATAGATSAGMMASISSVVGAKRNGSFRIDIHQCFVKMHKSHPEYNLAQDPGEISG